jgi:hypothetical protein
MNNITRLNVANTFLYVTCNAEYDAYGNDIAHGAGDRCGYEIKVPVGIQYEHDADGRRRMRVTVSPLIPMRCPAGHSWHEDDMHDIHNQIDDALFTMAG